MNDQLPLIEVEELTFIEAMILMVVSSSEFKRLVRRSFCV